eukprot:757391-Hanusia_phi.AAC.3
MLKHEELSSLPGMLSRILFLRDMVTTSPQRMMSSRDWKSRKSTSVAESIASRREGVKSIRVIPFY